jgi:hypothetical protein
MIRKEGDRKWLDRAHAHMLINGAATASLLRESLFINPNTNRPYSYNPTRNGAPMLLSMDKRFAKRSTRVQRTAGGDGTYSVSEWFLVEELQ